MPGEQASPRGALPVSVPADVEVELRAAAGQAVAAAAASSQRPPIGTAAVAEDARTAERRLREERQAALAAQKRV